VFIGVHLYQNNALQAGEDYEQKIDAIRLCNQNSYCLWKKGAQ
jgi:hypothetical protein